MSFGDFFPLEIFQREQSQEKNVSLGPHFVGERVSGWKVSVSVLFYYQEVNFFSPTIKMK